MPWKNNDVNDLLLSENDVREQLCFMDYKEKQIFVTFVVLNKFSKFKKLKSVEFKSE